MKGKRSEKSKQEKEKGLKELEQESTDMLLLRFGQPIPNIEALDKLSANKSAAEMGERMQAMAAEWEEELQARDIELKAPRHRWRQWKRTLAC